MKLPEQDLGFAMQVDSPLGLVTQKLKLQLPVPARRNIGSGTLPHIWGTENQMFLLSIFRLALDESESKPGT